MTIIKNGTRIKLVLNGAQGFTTAVTIRGEAIQYEVSVTINGDYRQLWVSEFEIEITSTNRQEIGFKTH